MMMPTAAMKSGTASVEAIEDEKAPLFLRLRLPPAPPDEDDNDEEEAVAAGAADAAEVGAALEPAATAGSVAGAPSLLTFATISTLRQVLLSKVYCHTPRLGAALPAGVFASALQHTQAKQAKASARKSHKLKRSARQTMAGPCVVFG